MCVCYGGSMKNFYEDMLLPSVSPLPQAYKSDVPPAPPPFPPPSPPSSSTRRKAEVLPAMNLRTPAAVKVEKKKPFVFISTFKWEMRKGWDKLVHAFLEVGPRTGE